MKRLIALFFTYPVFGKAVNRVAKSKFLKLLIVLSLFATMKEIPITSSQEDWNKVVQELRQELEKVNCQEGVIFPNTLEDKIQVIAVCLKTQSNKPTA